MAEKKSHYTYERAAKQMIIGVAMTVVAVIGLTIMGDSYSDSVLWLAMIFSVLAFVGGLAFLAGLIHAIVRLVRRHD